MTVLLAAVLAAAAAFLLVPGSSVGRLREVVDGRVSTDPLNEARQWVVDRLRGDRERDREAALQALVALAAELRAGQPPEAALANASQSAWPTALAAVRLGGDVPAALRNDAERLPDLRALAACWEVGATSGVGLAASVEQLAAASRDAHDVRGQLEVQLAGPRATARMLALLPVLGIVMGMLLGADPLGFLLGGPIGLACLVGGIGLTALGTWWTARIAARVTAQL